MIGFSAAVLALGGELLRWRGVFASRAVGLAGDAAHRGPPDETLVSLFQGGDLQAFELLVKRYQGLAFSICRRYLGNQEAAEETAQDVFLALFRQLKGFRGESSFKSWFYRVVVNHCRNKHKSDVRRKVHLHDSLDAPVESGDEPGRPKELPDDHLDPEHALGELQRQKLLERALQSLGEEGRMVLLLREGQGLAYEEIASSLGLNVGTVKSRIHRARAELKQVVDRLSMERGMLGSSSGVP